MLVLTREENEFIDLFIGDVHIELCPVSIRGDKVRIGITAPESVVIHRREIAEAIAEAAKSDPEAEALRQTEFLRKRIEARKAREAADAKSA